MDTFGTFMLCVQGEAIAQGASRGHVARTVALAGEQGRSVLDEFAVRLRADDSPRLTYLIIADLAIELVNHRVNGGPRPPWVVGAVE